MKWGLTGGTFAGTVLADLLNSDENPWSEALSPTRLSPGSWPRLAWHNLSAGADFVTDRVAPATATDVRELRPGTAAVAREGADRTGVYRDEEGLLHCVSMRCTHLGCLVRFNNAETTWDRPCHGSRFAVDGTVLRWQTRTTIANRESTVILMWSTSSVRFSTVWRRSIACTRTCCGTPGTVNSSAQPHS